MPRSVLIAAVAVGLTLAAHRLASADIIQYESLDLAVAGADLVVRGEVTEVVSQKGELGVVWNRVTIDVLETIKGEKLKSVSFLVREGPLEPQGTPWRNLRDEQLFCLKAPKLREGPFRVDYVLQGGWMYWAIPLNDKPATRLPIYSLGFRPLTEAKDILAAARAAAEDRALAAGALLEWVAQDGEFVYPAHAVHYPDSDRVRTAAERERITLFPLKR
jgi:hypothetical protein